MKDNLVSIIVPVYNVEKYLDRCLKSIISQTYKKIEILLIDDGSTDNSPKICDKFSKNDERIVVIHKKNEGVSIARNIGLEKAKGKYITFIDADDYVNSNYIEILYNLCMEKDADVSICGTVNEYIDGKILYETDVYKDCISGKDAIRLMLNKKYFGWTCWTKMYKLDKIKNVKFKSGVKIAEDGDFIYNVLKNIKYVNVNTYIKPYHYIISRKNSATEAKFNDDRKIEMEIYKNMKDDMEKIMPQDIELIKAWYLKRVLSTIALNIKTSKDKKYLRYLVNELKQISIKNKYIDKKQKILYMIITINPRILKILYKLKRGKI